jgi:uncharacterized protein involved in response to NO
MPLIDPSVTKPLESWRLFFPAAAALAVAGLGAWGAQLAGFPLGLSPADHGAFMLWGVLGTGVQGFLLTAYAKQNDAPLPSRPVLYGVLSSQALSAGLLLGRPALPIGLGAALVALPWVALLLWAAPVGLASLRRRWEPTTAAAPLALLGALVGVVLHARSVPAPRGVEVGVHAFLAPLALSLLDRLLPFFCSRVVPGYAGRRLPGFIPLLLLLSWAKVLAAAAAPALLLPIQAGLLLLLSRQVWGWRPWPAVKVPMLGVLHLGLAWIAVAWLLDLVGAPRSAGLHALLVGGLGSLFLGLSMRVARGHSGLPIVLGRAGAALLLLAQAAALLRVAAALGAGAASGLLLSATLLGLAFAVWLLRFLPVAAGR